MGNPRRILHDAELKRRLALRRSVFLEEPVKAGQELARAKVIFRRPGLGIGPDQYEASSLFTFRTDLPAGHMIKLSDLNS